MCGLLGVRGTVCVLFHGRSVARGLTALAIASTSGNYLAQSAHKVIVGCVLLLLLCVVVVVEWLNYSKRIIIVRWADLSDFFFVDFRR